MKRVDVVEPDEHRLAFNHLLLIVVRAKLLNFVYFYLFCFVVDRHLVIAPRSNVRDRYGGAYGGYLSIIFDKTFRNFTKKTQFVYREPFLFMHTIQRNRWLYLMENNPSKPVNIKTLCLSKVKFKKIQYYY